MLSESLQKGLRKDPRVIGWRKLSADGQSAQTSAAQNSPHRNHRLLLLLHGRTDPPWHKVRLENGGVCIFAVDATNTATQRTSLALPWPLSADRFPPRFHRLLLEYSTQGFGN